MLQFFRKNQKFIFLVVTIIVVCTFLFFGTYQAIAPAFQNRSENEESYVSQMARFLDTEQWMVSRKILAANFLNDDFVSKEFLETGMGELVALTYRDKFQEELANLHAKEKAYELYSHPFLSGLSTEMLWSIFAPEMASQFKKLQEGSGEFADRCSLFLSQKKFPPALFTQVIRYQEQNHPEIPADPRLAKNDIALFGYQTLTDWFGPKYMETLAELIIQIANKARKLGYKTTQQEVVAELLFHSQQAYQAIHGKVPLPVENGYGLLQLYLREVGIQEKTAIKIWEDLTLFRRLFHAVGNTALIDPLSLSRFYVFAFENATIELFQMPQEYRFKNLADLELFEAYLAAVSQKKEPFDIPSEFAPIALIKTIAPELVGKRYRVSFCQTSKKALQAKVSLRELEEWVCSSDHWPEIQSQFPELAQKKGAPFEILEKIEAKTRKAVDAFATKKIVEAHPNWISEALIEKEMEEKELFLSEIDREIPFEGMNHAKQLMEALDQKTEWMGYTQDQNFYYRFLVQEKGREDEILSFKEALKRGLLNRLVEKLEAKKRVQEIVAACPPAFQEVAFAYRFAPFMSTHHYSPPLGDLEKQFTAEKKEKTITRCEKSFIPFDELLTLEPGQISHVKVDAVEGAYLYRFVDKRTDKTIPIEKIQEAQSMLSQEARSVYFHKILHEMDPK